jgi:hypothetical protein
MDVFLLRAGAETLPDAGQGCDPCGPIGAIATASRPGDSFATPIKPRRGISAA